jgi:uncharacterized membrane protein
MKTENLKLKTENLLFPTLIILFGVFMRLVPHMPNFAPVTAIALFGGLYLEKKYALLIPIIIMMISDYFLGFHDTMLFVYVSFLIAGLLGMWVRKEKSFSRILTITLLSSVLFFIITNVGVWLMGDMYPKNSGGLIQAFVMAIPFFRNTVMGDLLYTTTFILMYEFMKYFLQRRTIAVSRRRK